MNAHPTTNTTATLIGLREGLGVEGIAVRHRIPVAEIRAVVEQLREEGLIRQACGMLDDVREE